MAAERYDSNGRALYKGECECKNGKYLFAYTDDHGRRVYMYAPTLKELREKEATVFKDRFDGIDTYMSGAATVNYLFDRYIGANRSRAHTKENMKYIYNHYLRNEFGKKSVGEVKYSDVVYLYEYFLNEKHLALNTLKSINRVLYPSFELAVRDDIIRNNPCVGALVAASHKPGRNHGVRKALSKEETAHFMAYIEKTPKYRHWKPLFTVMLGTGCRVGEIVALRWEDIDPKERTISINHSIVYYAEQGAKTSKSVLHVSQTKTAAGNRTIPMSDKVFEAFREEYLKQKKEGFCDAEIDGMSGFIFQNRNGTVHNPQTINLAIKRILEDHNLEEERRATRERREPVIIPSFSCHSLRHTFCSRFVENEENPKVVQAIMGHADIETTMNIYAEISDMKKHEVMRDLDKKEFW